MTPSITEAEFSLLSELVYRAAGIHLPPSKAPLLAARLSKRLKARGLRSFGAYHRLLKEGDPGELGEMLNALAVHETRFFRDPAQFDFLSGKVFPAWTADAEAGRRPRRVRAWTAACATGEEAWSLAMLLLDSFPPESGWSVEVLASDLSTRALAAAQEGVYSLERAGEIPEAYLKAYMLRGVRSQEGRMKAGPELRVVTGFLRVNLNDAVYPVRGPFDLIFCRNVFIYFDQASKDAAVRRALGLLAPEGILFLGLAESLAGTAWPAGSVRAVGPMAYAPGGARA